MNPRYPVYVISKGRWDTRLTVKHLEAAGIPYHVVIERQEYGHYAEVINPDKILVLPFSNLGQGSIPARNFVWAHSVDRGAKRHWILDDNLRGFFRFNRNLKTPVHDGTTFRCAEDFTDRYTNVKMSGMNYFMFVLRKTSPPPYYLNTRVYSCILLSNDLWPEYAWRGRYNEDTDLSLRILKAGYCTLLFNAFLCDKMTTMTMTGGNTEDLYEIEKGRLRMAQSLVDQHPDVARVSWKFGRHQHHVDYRRFKRLNKLERRSDLVVPPGVDNYGMVLQKQDDSGAWHIVEDPRDEIPRQVSPPDLTICERR